MKMKLFTLLMLFFMGISFGNAQEYKSAIGLRLGYPLSASYKTFISETAAIEGVAGFRSFSGYSWFNVGGYYQIHKELGSTKGLQWYYGAGANLYFWSFDSGFGGGSSTTSIGLSGVLGLDYKFSEAPLNISVDWIPTFFINGFGNGFSGGYGALAARYVLND